jgi:dTDP-4-dehydrorhamnose 3,5-epimerase
MTRLPTRLPDLILLQPRVFPDSRGLFFEAWEEARYRDVGIGEPFVQDNVSWSHPGVLRGMHVQNPQPQGKLVQALLGSIFDVALDVRAGSPTFGEWEAHELSEENRRQFFIPRGFAHGFLVLRGPALVTYKCTGSYFAAGELTVRFDDPDVGILWPTLDDAMVSEKDRQGVFLRDIPRDRLQF